MSWKLVALLLGLFVGLVFLVYEGKIDSKVIELFVTAIVGGGVGGGIVHLGSKLGGGGP